MRGYTRVNELYHHGIKGMKWGVRRYQNKDGSLTSAGKKRHKTDDREKAKEAKKTVKTLSKALGRDGRAGQMVRMGVISKYDKEYYDILSRAMDAGSILVKAKFKKNYEQQSVDLYIGHDKTPTVRARLENGERIAVEFINKADQIRYNEFADYYNKRHR